MELANNLPYGDYAEIGVYQGDTARKIAECMDRNAKLWLFDSFEGHSTPCEFDHPDHYQGRYSDTSVELVASKVPTATIVKGFISETLHTVSDIRFRYVRIDVDNYWPTRTACLFFRYRMVPGGIMEFDDYAVPTCEGATKAIDEVMGPINPPGDFYWWRNDK